MIMATSTTITTWHPNDDYRKRMCDVCCNKIEFLHENGYADPQLDSWGTRGLTRDEMWGVVVVVGDDGLSCKVCYNKALHMFVLTPVRSRDVRSCRRRWRRTVLQSLLQQGVAHVRSDTATFVGLPRQHRLLSCRWWSAVRTCWPAKQVIIILLSKFIITLLSKLTIILLSKIILVLLSKLCHALEP